MPLSDLKIQAATCKPGAKQTKKHDSKGLYLIITDQGRKYWRLRYEFNGDRSITFEEDYPEISLDEARYERDRMLGLLEKGIDPSEERKAKKRAAAVVSATLKEITYAFLYFQTNLKTYETAELIKHIPTPVQDHLAALGHGRQWSPSYTDNIKNRLDRHVIGKYGQNQIDDVDMMLIGKILGPLKPDIQHRIKGDLLRVLEFSKLLGLRKNIETPSAKSLEQILKKRTGKNFPAIIDSKEYGVFLRGCDVYHGDPQTRDLMRLQPLLFVRPTELRCARWNEFDFDQSVWIVPQERMKSTDDFIVPLSTQAVEILKDLMPLTRTRRSSYVFPSSRFRGLFDERPLSDAIYSTAIANMGYRGIHTGHGARASAKTILKEVLKVREEVIELQLHHLTKDPNGTAYDRTAFLEERFDMMQKWADYLDLIKSGKGITHNHPRIVNGRLVNFIRPAAGPAL